MAKTDFELPSEVSEFIDIKADKLDDFKTKFEEVYVRKDKLGDNPELLKPHFGKAVGEIETKLRSKAREFGVDLKDDGIPSGTKTTEVVDILFNKAIELRDARVTELEGKIKTPDDTSLVKLQEEFETYKASSKKEFEDERALKEDAVNKFKELETTTSQKFKEIKIDTLTNQANSKVKWATESEGFELKKKGFDAQMRENYKTGFNESDEFVVTDAKGERIKDDKVTGQYKSYDAILAEEAEKAGLIKTNPNGGKPASPLGFGKPPKQEIEGETKRNINRSTR